MLEKQRNSNIELLRIIAMLLIVMDHYVTHGLMGHGGELVYCLDRYIADISITGKYGNDIFILISGYYMSQSHFTARKLAKLWGEVVFYAVVLFGIFTVLNRGGTRRGIQPIRG